MLIHPGFFGGNAFVQVRLFGWVSQVIDRIQDRSWVTDCILGVLRQVAIDFVKDIVSLLFILNISQVLEERCPSFPGRIGMNQIHETIDPVAVDGFAGQSYSDIGLPDSSGQASSNIRYVSIKTRIRDGFVNAFSGSFSP